MSKKSHENVIPIRPNQNIANSNNKLRTNKLRRNLAIAALSLTAASAGVAGAAEGLASKHNVKTNVPGASEEQADRTVVVVGPTDTEWSIGDRVTSGDIREFTYNLEQLKPNKAEYQGSNIYPGDEIIVENGDPVDFIPRS